MTTPARLVLDQALRLDIQERAALAALLIDSLDPGSDEGADQAWAAEIGHRLAQLDSGEVVTVPWEQVKERMDRLLSADREG